MTFVARFRIDEATTPAAGAAWVMAAVQPARWVACGVLKDSSATEPYVALYEQEGNDHVNHLVDLVGHFTPGTFIEAKLTHMGASRMATCDARLGVSAVPALPRSSRTRTSGLVSIRPRSVPMFRGCSAIRRDGRGGSSRLTPVLV